MPKGSRVERCVRHVKSKGTTGNAYAICQASTGQSYATGRTMKKAKYNTKLMSPKGDFAAYQEVEYRRAFPRKMKNDGKTVLASKALPYHGADPMEKDRGM